VYKLQEVFQIAILVIGVGGAVYTALSAIRFTFAEEVKDKKIAADRFVGITKKLGNDKQRDKGDRFHENFRNGVRYWYWSFVVPVVFFNVFVVILASEVCIAYFWIGDEAAADWAKKFEFWHFFFLALLVFVNTACIFAAYLSLSMLRSAYGHLADWAGSVGPEESVK